MKKKNLNVAALSSAFFITACSLALSSQAALWQLPDRQVDLAQEIDMAEKCGDISHEASMSLRAEEDQIIQKSNDLKAKHNGVLSTDELKDIQTDVENVDKKLHKLISSKEDNTAKNLGDDRIDAITAQDQSENKQDITVTATIRSELSGDKALSLNAKNIKIVTINGLVTLQGVVENDFEKNRVVATAERLAGKDRVVNELKTVK